MDQSYIEKNQEAAPEIHVIPAEFYGGVKRGATALAAPGGEPRAVSSLAEKSSRQSSFFHSPKFIVLTAAFVFILIVGGFAFYYIRQAGKLRQELVEKPAPALIEEPATAVFPSEPEPPVPPVSVLETSAPPPVPDKFSIIFPFKNYTSSPDSDNDGLTDEEEEIYGTDPNLPDSDSDGYLDSVEVENLYNPLGFKPVRLLDSGKVKVYQNPVFGYSIFYPEKWIAQSLDASAKEVIFTAENGEFMEVLAEENILRVPAAAWYLGQSPGADISQLPPFETKEKIEGIKSPDGLTAYLPFEDSVFVINYNIGLKTEAGFLKTFEMMINSFRPRGGTDDLPFGGVAAPAP